MNKRTEDQMERARAARLILKDSRPSDHPDQKEEVVAAFMAIFHPERQLPANERYTDEKSRTGRRRSDA